KSTSQNLPTRIAKGSNASCPTPAQKLIRPSNLGPIRPTLRANSFPKVMNLICYFPYLHYSIN
ncbi:hypothetical protein C2G38_2283354, partial [Gigaspora rosea]